MKNLMLLLALFITSCSDDVELDDIFEKIEFSKNEIPADGTSVTVLSITLNKLASISESTIEATLSRGLFEENKSNEISLIPERQPNGEIIAETKIISPLTPGEVSITLDIQDYIQNTTYKTTISKPTELKLTSSSFKVQASFGDEVTITGILSNNIGKKVSLNHLVEFDEYLEDGTHFKGFKREEKLKSNSDSQVSFIYTPGNISPNQIITLIGYVLDDELNRTSTTKQLQIHVTEKE